MASRRPVDDSDEEEATALELRTAPSAPQKSKSTPLASPSSPSLPSRSSLVARALPSPSPAPAPRPAPRAPVTADVDDDDDDATEFLQARPSRKPSPSTLAAPPSAPSPRAPGGSPLNAAPAPLPRSSSATNLPSAPSLEPALRARGRAVPIGGDEERSVPNPPATSTERAVSPRASGRDATEPIAVVDGVPRGARPLPERSDVDENTTGTESIPRITRIHVVGPGASTTTDGIDDGRAVDAAGAPTALTERPVSAVRSGQRGAPPLASAAFTSLPTLADASRGFAATTDRIQHDESDDDTNASQTDDIRAARRAATSTGDDAPADGTLVVEAPPDAVVVVNGIERGRGHVRVGDLDRNGRHAVRILRPGFHTWSGSVSLDGKPAAKIRPTLKPRSR